MLRKFWQNAQKGVARVDKQRVCEHIVRDEQGELWIEGCRAADLAATYGTPLYVTSESQIRQNYRRIQAAFAAEYPNTQLLCAMKANNNLAVRRILSDEGAGGEAFGAGELIALLDSGANPRKCVLNGAYKEDLELRKAIECGVRINADSEKELRDIERVARELGKTAEVRLRLRLQVPEFDEIPAQAGGKTISERFANSKFGLSPVQALKCAEYIKGSAEMEFKGYSFHLGRQSLDVRHFAYVMREIIAVADLIYRKLGLVAEVINIGGGLPSSPRDPEGHGTSGPVPPVEDYAVAIAGAIREGLAKGFLVKEPVLELEPGRSVVGCATVLLTKVMVHKENLGHHWLVVNCGGNQVSRIDSARFYYQTIKASHETDASDSQPIIADVCGNLCSADFISRETPVLDPKEGDLLAVLDTGMYAETTASQFNGRPRPATVLVHEKESVVIKRRESFSDVFATQCVPARYEKMCDAQK